MYSLKRVIEPDSIGEWAMANASASCIAGNKVLKVVTVQEMSLLAVFHFFLVFPSLKIR